jgi:hypothetical protein
MSRIQFFRANGELLAYHPLARGFTEALADVHLRDALQARLDAGRNIGQVAYCTYLGPEFGPEGLTFDAPMLVRARQDVLRRRGGSPSVAAMLYGSDGQLPIAVPQVLVEGTVEREYGGFHVLHHNTHQVAQDAWVLALLQLVEAGAPAADFRRLMQVSWMEWRVSPTEGPTGDYGQEATERMLRMAWCLDTVRQYLDGDIDAHDDEAEDLEFGTGPVVTWLRDPYGPSDAADDAGDVAEPAITERTFGLEIEFTPNGYSQEHYGRAVREALAPFPDAAPVEVTGYRHSDGGVWDLKPDSSCGFELASPALTWAEWPQMDAVLRSLYKAGARIDVRCGFHVHHEAADLRATGLRRLLLLWMAYEKVLMASVRDSRKGNRYCDTFTNAMGGDFERFKAQLSPLSNMRQVIADLGRYRALNATGWWNHGRIEVRLHHGTLHPGAIKFWTLMTQQMIEFAKTTRSYQAMEEAFGAEFATQVDQFKMSLTATRRHPEVAELPLALDRAIRRRSPVLVGAGV